MPDKNTPHKGGGAIVKASGGKASQRSRPVGVFTTSTTIGVFTGYQ
jgi:hypothetical protein